MGEYQGRTTETGGVEYFAESGGIYSKTKKLEKEYIGEENGQSIMFGGLTLNKLVYLNDVQRDAYEIFVRNGMLYDFNGNLLNVDKKAIFVMDENGAIFVNAQPKTFYFHHSSFLAGNKVASAGHIVVDQGVLKSINAQTGHYKILPNLNKQLLEEFQKRGVDISKVQDFGYSNIN